MDTLFPLSSSHEPGMGRGRPRCRVRDTAVLRGADWHGHSGLQWWSSASAGIFSLDDATEIHGLFRGPDGGPGATECQELGARLLPPKFYVVAGGAGRAWSPFFLGWGSFPLGKGG